MKKVMTFLVVLMLVLFTGCGQVAVEDEVEQEVIKPTAEVEEEAKEPIKIGAIYPLTGDGAAYGIPLQELTDLAVEDLNSAGGINGKPLELLYEDGKCNPKDGASAAQKLISMDNVKVILGGLCSGETLGAAPITEEAKVILFSPGSGSPDITDAGDYVFRNFPSDATSGSKVGKFAYEQGYTKVAILSENTDFAQGVKGVFLKVFEPMGGEVVADETFDSSQADYRTQVTKIKASNPDAVYLIPQTPSKFGLALKQINEIGVEAPLLTNEFAAAGDILEQYAEYVEGAIYAEPYFDEEAPLAKPVLDKYVAKYEELPGSLPPVYLATAYDAVFILADAIEKHGEDTEAIKEFLYGIKDREGAAGMLTMDENGDPSFEYVLRVIKDNKPSLFEEEVAEETEEAEEDVAEEDSEEEATA